MCGDTEKDLASIIRVGERLVCKLQFRHFDGDLQRARRLLLWIRACSLDEKDSLLLDQASDGCVVALSRARVEHRRWGIELGIE